MIPDKIFFLDSLHKNKNGKIDKILLQSEWEKG
jgi:acyl-coenzyme A synthetase/AMP-(fatty) acid ligase